MSTVVLVGCLDTKADEYAFVRERLIANGIDVLVVDTGVLAPPAFEPDVARDEVAAAVDTDIAALATGHTCAKAVEMMAAGAGRVVARLRAEGRCDGALAVGGTGGASIGAQAFKALPIGVPKAIVSTAVVTGHAPAYVGQSDLVLFPAVVDIAGINRISGRVLANAAAALAGMVNSAAPPSMTARPAVAASMFGVTTAGVTAARRHLAKLGYEVVVFHMTGVGGRTMERLVGEGQFAGVLDVTTHELADELVGGVFSAGSARLTTAAKAGIPQVVSVGALDMVNFHTPDTIPARFADRDTLIHNPAVTIIRTLPDEAAELGARLAARLAAGTAPATVFLPLRGMSAYGVENAPFHDPVADAALFDAIRSTIDPDCVRLVELDLDINDPGFGVAMAECLHQNLTRLPNGRPGRRPPVSAGVAQPPASRSPTFASGCSVPAARMSSTRVSQPSAVSWS